MNKRIKELAVQADLLIKKTNGDEFRYGNFDPKFQKFAELIIDECCLKLLDMDGKTKGNHNYYKHAALEIKKHFRGE